MKRSRGQSPEIATTGPAILAPTTHGFETTPITAAIQLGWAVANAIIQRFGTPQRCYMREGDKTGET